MPFCDSYSEPRTRTLSATFPIGNTIPSQESVPTVMQHHCSIHDVAPTIFLQLPDHIHNVYCCNNLNKTKMIAKDVHKGLREPDIFHFLQKTGWKSLHVISPIKIITPITKEWLILPKMLPINQQFMDNSSVSACTKLEGAHISSQAQNSPSRHQAPQPCL